MNQNINKCKYIHDYDYTEKPFLYGDLMLYQIGEAYCENNAIIPIHTHENFIELSYIVDGKGMMISNDIKQIVNKGDLFLSLPFEKHAIFSDSYEPLRYFYLAISFTDESKYKEILFSEKILNLQAKDRIYHANNAKIANTFNNLLSVLENKNEYSSLKFELLVKTFMLDIYDIYNKVKSVDYNSPVIRNDDSIYYQITKYIDDNLLKINSLKDIALSLNHNYSYLSRIFKEKFGKSMHEYFAMQKINQAKKLIEENKMTLTEISEYLNYSSLFVFSRSFKQICGTSPQNYKNDFLKNK